MPQAEDDLKDKLALEEVLYKKINKVNRDMARETARLYGLTGNTLDAATFKEEIEKILTKHYGSVSSVFSKRVSPLLDEDAGITDKEKTAIAAALFLYFIARSGDQSTIITDTNQRQIDEAIGRAKLAADADMAQGITSTQMGVAAVAGVMLYRNLTARTGLIASFETQNIAETAKRTEIEVLLGQEPSIANGIPSQVINITKRWDSMGDSLVRAAHAAADGQVVDFNEPFIVGGERLMRPSDTSLGASMGNVINCRCSSITPVNEINEYRSQ